MSVSASRNALRRRHRTGSPHWHSGRRRHVVLLRSHGRGRLGRHDVGGYPPFLEDSHILPCHGAVAHVLVILVLLRHLRRLGGLLLLLLYLDLRGLLRHRLDLLHGRGVLWWRRLPNYVTKYLSNKMIRI